MSFKKQMMERGMKAMQDPRVMKAMAKGFEMKGKVQQNIDTRVESMANSLNLATKAEVRELKRNLRKMERELKKAQKALAAAQSNA